MKIPRRRWKSARGIFPKGKVYLFLLQEAMVQEGLHLHLESRETGQSGRPLLHPFAQFIVSHQMGCRVGDGFLGVKLWIYPRLYIGNRIRVDPLGSETLPFITSRHRKLLFEHRSSQGRPGACKDVLSVSAGNRDGHQVHEPRDIWLGHKSRDVHQQEPVLGWSVQGHRQSVFLFSQEAKRFDNLPTGSPETAPGRRKRNLSTDQVAHHARRRPEGHPGRPLTHC